MCSSNLICMGFELDWYICFEFDLPYALELDLLNELDLTYDLEMNFKILNLVRFVFLAP